MRLGGAYYDGVGVRKNNKQALYWLEQSLKNDRGDLNQAERINLEKMIKHIKDGK